MSTSLIVGAVIFVVAVKWTLTPRLAFSWPFVVYKSLVMLAGWAVFFCMLATPSMDSVAIAISAVAAVLWSLPMRVIFRSH